MSSTWQKAYDELKDFVAQNPTVEITANCIAIPGDVRPQFYQMFDTVRVNFLKDNFAASLEKGYELSRNFARMYKTVMDQTKLESINVRAGVNWFLQDPTNGLIRPLFDPLFNYLRGKLTEAEFDKTATELIEKAFDDYFRDGYRRWVMLGLMSLNEPDKHYGVEVRDYQTDSTMSEGDIIGGLREETPEQAAETNKVVFDICLLASFIPPRLIMHSKRLGRFVGLHSDFNEAHWRARYKSEKMEWIDLQELKKEYGQSKLWPDLLFYTSDELGDLNLIADHFWVARPDLIVEVREDEGWYERGGLELARRHIAELKPRLGCYIVCRTEPPPEAYEELKPRPPVATQVSVDEMTIQELPHGEVTGDESAAVDQILQEQVPPQNAEADIHILPVGYDYKKLDALVEELIQYRPALEK
jgi:hypothetical protein